MVLQFDIFTTKVNTRGIYVAIRALEHTNVLSLYGNVPKFSDRQRLGKQCRPDQTAPRGAV